MVAYPHTPHDCQPRWSQIHNNRSQGCETDPEIPLPPTLKDLAAAAEVSTAAASMALNNKPGVSEATRQRVQALAQEMGYRVNRSGKSLREGRTGNIGVYFPTTVLEYSHYYAEITRGIADGLADTDLSPVILPSAGETGIVTDFPTVDGYIIVEPHSDDLGMRELLRQDKPTVCVDPPSPDAAPPWGIIEPDTAASLISSMDHLVAGGSRRPGVLTIESVSQWTAMIEESYQGWCLSRGVSPIIIRADATQNNEALRVALSAAVSDAEAPCDGLFICGDGFAVRVAGVLRSIGLHVGEDFGLVSGVDSTMMEFHTPPISSVDMNPFGYGRDASSMIHTLLKGRSRNTTTLRHYRAAPLVSRAT